MHTGALVESHVAVTMHVHTWVTKAPFLLEKLGGFEDFNGWEWHTIRSLMTASR